MLLVSIIVCFGAYENAKGEMHGINHGIFNERKTWTEWYRRHQEDIKEHNIGIQEPTTSKLVCPKCGGNHDLLKV